MYSKVLLTPLVKSRIEHLEKIQKIAMDLFVKKNEDYDNAFNEFCIIGILMKIRDKIQTAINNNKESILFINDESMKNTLIDLQNYAAIGLMVFEENEKNLDLANEKFQIDKN